jgi:hypothetical protein
MVHLPDSEDTVGAAFAVAARAVHLEEKEAAWSALVAAVAIAIAAVGGVMDPLFSCLGSLQVHRHLVAETIDCAWSAWWVM